MALAMASAVVVYPPVTSWFMMFCSSAMVSGASPSVDSATSADMRSPVGFAMRSSSSGAKKRCASASISE